MIPVLFEIPLFGGIPVHSFGLMMALAFVFSGTALKHLFRLRGIPARTADQLILTVALAGIVGAKLYFVLFESFQRFTQDPVYMLLSGAGLTWYGGFILALIAVVVMIRVKKLPFGTVMASFAVVLPLGYGIGRIGCHLSGDGDYGLPTDGWWGVDYSKGIVPPSMAFRGSSVAETFPGGVVPDTVLCHPTPLYETALSVGIFALLYFLFRRNVSPALIAGLYFILAGMERFFIEFIRINKPALWGLTQAQWISMVFILAGGVLMVAIYFRKNY